MGAFAIPLALGAAALGWGMSKRGKNKNTSTTVLAPGQTTSSRTRTPTAPANPNTTIGDARKRTPNAVETGRFAIQRPAAGSDTAGTPTPPDASKARADAATSASRAAAKMKRKGASQRPGTLLTGPITPGNLSPRTLLGYA